MPRKSGEQIFDHSLPPNLERLKQLATLPIDKLGNIEDIDTKTINLQIKDYCLGHLPPPGSKHSVKEIMILNNTIEIMKGRDKLIDFYIHEFFTGLTDGITAEERNLEERQKILKNLEKKAPKPKIALPIRRKPNPQLLEDAPEVPEVEEIDIDSLLKKFAATIESRPPNFAQIQEEGQLGPAINFDLPVPFGEMEEAQQAIQLPIPMDIPEQQIIENQQVEEVVQQHDFPYYLPEVTVTDPPKRRRRSRLLFHIKNRRIYVPRVFTRFWDKIMPEKKMNFNPLFSFGTELKHIKTYLEQRSRTAAVNRQEMILEEEIVPINIDARKVSEQIPMEQQPPMGENPAEVHGLQAGNITTSRPLNTQLAQIIASFETDALQYYNPRDEQMEPAVAVEPEIIRLSVDHDTLLEKILNEMEKQGKPILFTDICPYETTSRVQASCIFAALLEMDSKKMIRLEQAEPYGAIIINVTLLSI